MSISAEDLKTILLQQQQQFETAQLRMIETLTQMLSVQPTVVQNNGKPSADAMISSVNEFIFDPDSGLIFDAWFRRYEDVFRAELSGLDDASKVRLLLRKLGTVEHDRYINYILPNNAHDFSFDDTVARLTALFGDQSSLFNNRYNCLKLCKKDNDSLIAHAAIVKRECQKFKLKSLTEDQFECLILVCSLQSPKDAEIRTRILGMLERDTDVTLQNAIAEAQRIMNLKHDTAMVEDSRAHSADISVQRISGNNPPTAQLSRYPQSKPPSPCWQCGGWHFVRWCPFSKHVCQRCFRRGHKETHCRFKTSFRSSCDTRKAGYRRFATRVNANYTDNIKDRRKFVTITINGRVARLQIDTASDITVITENLWKAIGSPDIKPTNHKAKSASGTSLNLIGQIECECRFANFTAWGTIFVTTHKNLNLLGLDWIERFNLLDVPINQICASVHLHKPKVPKAMAIEQIREKYAPVFREGLGKCTKLQASLSLKPDAVPVFRAKRPVPYAAVPIVDQELDRLEKLGVIYAVNYSSWAAPIVVVKKPNGQIRICADFSTGLNEALNTHQYPLPVPDDLFSKLNGGQCFAKLDLSDAYLQIEVDEASRELLTINTHRGLYQYHRLPFGVKSAPAIFQQIMDTMLTDVDGAAAYLDDIIVVGTNPDDLFRKLHLVLDRIQEYGFRLRPEKCTFFMDSINFLGFIIDKNGRRPDPSNIDAIKKMPPPKDVPTLRSFLGLVSHYSQFLPHMHSVRGPLNELLTKDKRWHWSEDCQKSFEEVKRMLCSDLMLTHYDPTLEIVVAADASKYGVGAVISHKFADGSEKAIAHAARSLSPAEKNYGQIEKEALAIVFAIKKFHKMLYGRRFTLLTDHKPLLAIFGSKSGIPVYTANRLQRWATALLAYDFAVKYTATKDIGQADALSRLLELQQHQQEESIIAAISLESEVNQVLMENFRKLPVTFDMVRDATVRDPLLRQVIKFHTTQWPSDTLSGELQILSRRKDELSIVNGCLLLAERIIIPKELRQRVLQQFHRAHPGINRMKSIARSFVYWPNIDSELEQLVKSCPRCALASKAPRKADLASWPLATKPWERVHADFFGPLNGQQYLIVVDSYSKWPEVFCMERATSGATINILRRLFSQHGIPETLVTDNGSQFTSSQFAEYCAQHGITHLRSPPFHPQSNGQAERFVDTFKRSLLKMRGEGTTQEILDTFLLVYRSTSNPQVPNQLSPAEALMGRKLRTVNSLLTPRCTNEQERNVRMEQYYNERHRTQARRFYPGQRVLVRDYRAGNPQWVVGSIRRNIGQVLYEVNVGNLIWTRHSNQLRPTSIPAGTSARLLPLDILLESFDMPSNPQSNSDASRTEVSEEPKVQTRRCTDRLRRPVVRMQLDPKMKSYVNFCGGRC
ncbi:unnamed protein product [Dicrocoelium dendriticum]|nr:unnamed protein product [Dicrocoelium dendriticum]